jgi:signal transduction histidine kinase
MDTTPETDRLRALLDVGIALSSELALDAVLQKTVEAATALTGARYAALGVIDEGRTGLERFVHTGIAPAKATELGELPRGRGILGLLIEEARPLRLHELEEHPASVGFPPHHPPMRTFLGVPVLIRGVAWGNLYLTEKAEGEDFTEADEEIARVLAAQAAVAVENARLYESATRWSRQLEALHEVLRSIVGESQLPRLLELIARRLRELVEAETVLIVRPTPDGQLRVEATAGGDAGRWLGHRLDRRASKSARVLERRRSVRIDDVLTDPEINEEFAREQGMRAAMFVPLVVGERALGVVVVQNRLTVDGRFSDADLRLAEIFAGRAAVACDLSERVGRETMRRVIEGQELERRRLARELHDETGQALTSILLGLKAVRAAGSEEEGAQVEEEVRGLVVQALHEVRRLAVELRPQALDDFGLMPAVERLTETIAERSGIEIHVHANVPPERLPGEVETVLYRLVQEALTNVVKHANASTVSVLVALQDGAVSAIVEDDGRGFAPGNAREDALGLLGMRERLASLGGELTIESTPGAGTTVRAVLPVGDYEAAASIPRSSA